MIERGRWQTTRDAVVVLFDDFDMYLRSLYKKKRTAASHVLVIMISSERHDEKPYAIPIQYVPCGVLRDQYVRDLLSGLKRKLQDKGLRVAGMYILLCNEGRKKELAHVYFLF